MKQFREMVVANQNETVRKDVSQAQVYLATVGLIGCVGVIFYSPKTQRVSLTHCDPKTDLNFLQQEHSWVGSDCRVFLIKNRGDWYLPLQMALHDLGMRDIDVLPSNEGTVVFNHTKGCPQTFKMSDFINLTTPKAIPLPDNKLYTLGYHPTFSEANLLLVQKRTYERQLNAAASLIASHLPLLVHQESGWLPTTLSLAEDVMSRIQNSSLLNRVSIDYVWPRYQILLRQIEQVTEKESLKTSSMTL